MGQMPTILEIYMSMYNCKWEKEVANINALKFSQKKNLERLPSLYGRYLHGSDCLESTATLHRLLLPMTYPVSSEAATTLRVAHHLHNHLSPHNYVPSPTRQLIYFDCSAGLTIVQNVSPRPLPPQPPPSQNLPLPRGDHPDITPLLPITTPIAVYIASTAVPVTKHYHPRFHAMDALPNALHILFHSHLHTQPTHLRFIDSAALLVS